MLRYIAYGLMLVCVGGCASVPPGGTRAGPPRPPPAVALAPAPDSGAPPDDDADGDGFSAAQGDCDDADPAVSPAAAEVCGDGVDTDCAGADGACPAGGALPVGRAVVWRGAAPWSELGAALLVLPDGGLIVGAPGAGALHHLPAPLEGGVAPAAAVEAAVWLPGAGPGAALGAALAGEGAGASFVGAAGAPGADGDRGGAVIFDASLELIERVDGAGPAEQAGAALTFVDGALWLGAPQATAATWTGGVRAPGGGLWAGARVGERAGSSLAALDLDGDGQDELVVGAPEAGDGRIYLLWSPDPAGGALADAALVLDGGGAYSQVGRTLGALGDQDGDGRPDLAVGAPLGALNGAVLVFSATDLLAENAAEVGIFGAVGVVTDTWSLLGEAGPAGDVDGDGLADVCAGGPQVVFGPVEGAVSATAADLRLLADTGPDGLARPPGWRCAPAGDLDGDGRGDVAFGGPTLEADGQAWGLLQLALSHGE